MEVIKEILRLPNFGYVFYGKDNKYHTAILGGHSCLPPEKCDIRLRYEYINHLNNEMVTLYEKGNLSSEDKTYLAKLMQKMTNTCETRLEGNFTPKEQTEYLNGLTVDELKQIEQQVQMHLDCRIFYRDFIFKK